MNPFHRYWPMTWCEDPAEKPPTWFGYIHDQARYYGGAPRDSLRNYARGYARMIRWLLPTFQRATDAWYITGPQWVTRECDEAERWTLFEIGRSAGEWLLRGPNR